MCSVVEYYGDFGKSSCGYCKGGKTSESAGMTAHVLSVEDYQDLIDRGWRRCGKYCYKPSNKTTCCPSYTIRCSLDDFALSKSHKKILKTMNKFLKDGVKDKSTMKSSDSPADDTSSQAEGVVETEYLRAATRELPAVENACKMEIVKGSDDGSPEVKDQSVSNAGESSSGEIEKKKKEPQNREELGKPKKKKQIRLERRQAKLAAKGLSIDEQKPSDCNADDGRKTLEDFLDEEPKDGKHKLKVKLIPSNSAPAKASYDLYKRYQMSVHHDPETKLKPENFQRFLCVTPLQPEDTQTEYTLGSFHQQYYLDDKLIAVAVIDILPKCLSSVYFFYDPEYGFLSLGTYSSLRELAFARQLQKELPELQFYYMGFYIHSCPKMRYKARLTASYLLCPEVYTWHKITDELLKKLDEAKYLRFNEQANAKDGDDVTQEDLKKIPMFNDGKPIPLEQYLRKCKDSTVFSRAHQYAKYVGRKCARRIVLYL